MNSQHREEADHLFVELVYARRARREDLFEALLTEFHHLISCAVLAADRIRSIEDYAEISRRLRIIQQTENRLPVPPTPTPAPGPDTGGPTAPGVSDDNSG